MAKAKLITMDRPTSVSREKVREVVARTKAQFVTEKKEKGKPQGIRKGYCSELLTARMVVLIRNF